MKDGANFFKEALKNHKMRNVFARMYIFWESVWPQLSSSKEGLMTKIIKKTKSPRRAWNIKKPLSSLSGTVLINNYPMRSLQTCGRIHSNTITHTHTLTHNFNLFFSSQDSPLLFQFLSFHLLQYQNLNWKQKRHKFWMNWTVFIPICSTYFF